MFDRNASHLITQILPSSLPPSHPLNPTDCHINLVNPTAAEGQYIKTEYAYIRTYISDLHDEHKDDIDLFLHLGMAAGWDFVSIEQKGYRQDFSWGWGSDEKQELYRIKDAAGKTVLDAPVLPWASRVPFGLIGTLDPITMAERANKSLEGARKSDNEETPGSGGKEKSHGLSVKIHSDPGSYCCGFTYYESLANKYAKGTRGHVMFCHVPEETDQELSLIHI